MFYSLILYTVVFYILLNCPTVYALGSPGRPGFPMVSYMLFCVMSFIQCPLT